VSNSFGGYATLHYTACYHRVVKGVTLLHCNATPFRGFFPNPVKYLRIVDIFLGLNIAPTISYKEICRIFVSI